jgi:adenine phosphoribosyltransferase
VANKLGSGFVPIRKAGKLPHESISAQYGLEYGTDVLEIHKDAVKPGSKVLLIDDVLATGGTIGAAIDLIQRIGGEVIHVLALLEISGLSGREKINETYPEIPITSFLIS